MKKTVFLALLLYMTVLYITDVYAQNDTGAYTQNSIAGNNTNITDGRAYNSIQDTNTSNTTISNENSGSANGTNTSKVTIKIYRTPRKSQTFEIILFLVIISVTIYMLKRKDI